MIIPWQELSEEALLSIVESFVLREGTDYGSREYSLVEKVDEILLQIKNESLVIVWSELHQSANIMPRNQFDKQSKSEDDKIS